MSEENNSLRRRGEGADLEPRLVRILSLYIFLEPRLVREVIIVIIIFWDTVSMGKV